MARDDPIGEANQYMNRQMEAAERACYETAKANGHSQAEADNCDEGSVGCPNCPFLKGGGE